MIKDNVAEVEANIQKACERAGRSRDEVTLIAVSKTKPVSDIYEVMETGIKDYGENKVQELCDKMQRYTDAVCLSLASAQMDISFLVGKERFFLKLFANHRHMILKIRRQYTANDNFTVQNHMDIMNRCHQMRNVLIPNPHNIRIFFL